MVYVAHLEGMLNVAQQEYPIILSEIEFQKHLRDCLFHGFCKHCVIPYATHMMTQG